MKNLAILPVLSLFVTACSQPASNPSDTDLSSDNGAMVSGESTAEDSACSKLDLSIKDAPWAKRPSGQAPHELVIKKADGTTKSHELGIDRSPDFFFKIETTDFHEFALIKGASRFLAYDCRNGRLQELDVSMEPQTELVDAQSGLIIDVNPVEDGILYLKVRDYKTVKYKLDANRSFIRF